MTLPSEVVAWWRTRRGYPNQDPGTGKFSLHVISLTSPRYHDQALQDCEGVDEVLVSVLLLVPSAGNRVGADVAK